MPKKKKPQSTVELGYAEELEDEDAYLLTSPFFPSKIGGRPAWLTLDNIPGGDLTCDLCSRPLIFLLQVYAPLTAAEDRKESAFHRTVFVFICRDPDCYDPVPPGEGEDEDKDDLKNKKDGGGGDRRRGNKKRGGDGNGDAKDSETAKASDTDKESISILRQGCVKVVRSQCGRANAFYPYDPLDPDLLDADSLRKDGGTPGAGGGVDGLRRAEDFGPLCLLCGARASVKCDKCSSTDYCSVDHAEFHWKMWHHHECGKSPEDLAKFHGSTKQKGEKKAHIMDQSASRLLFPEFELQTEREGLLPPAKPEEERPEAERMKDLEEFLKKSPDESVVGGGENLDALEDCSVKLDKYFKAFQRRVAANPEQVLRYDRNGREGTPLWASPALPPHPVPPCGACGGERVFEFQLMPHLLGVIGVDTIGKSIDFATVAVFTCKRSCDSERYVNEFVWRQNFA